MLALESEFEKALYLYDEDYDTDVNYDLPQPLEKSACIYAVSWWLKYPLTPWVIRDLNYPPSHPPQKEGQQNLHFIKWSTDI